MDELSYSVTHIFYPNAHGHFINEKEPGANTISQSLVGLYWGQSFFVSSIVPTSHCEMRLTPVKFLPFSEVANRPFCAVYSLLKEMHRVGGIFVFVRREEKYVMRSS